MHNDLDWMVRQARNGGGRERRREQAVDAGESGLDAQREALRSGTGTKKYVCGITDLPDL